MVVGLGSLFNVAARVIIRTIPDILVRNMKGEGLTIDWQVDKSRTPSADKATIAIRNLSSANRKVISNFIGTSSPLSVDLEVGWTEAPEVLFSGTAWKVTPERYVGTDILTVLEVGDGANELRDTPPAGGAALGLGVKLAVAKLLGDLGIQPAAGSLEAVDEAAAKVPLLNRTLLVFDQDPRDALNELLASVKLSWGIDKGRFVVFRAGLRNDVQTVTLKPQSGLLDWAEEDDGSVTFEALAQPKLVPGGQVSVIVDTPRATGADGRGEVIRRERFVGGGPLRVESVTFTGSTMGQSLMSGVARKVEILSGT